MPDFTKPVALLLLLSWTLSANAQSRRPHPRQDTTIDSVEYYRKIISEMSKKTYDSLHQSEAYKTANEGWQRNIRKSNGYTSFALFGDVGQASYDVVNKGIVQAGFPPLNGPQYRLGLGISQEFENRLIMEFYFAVIGINNKSKKGDSSVKSSYNNILQFNFGYDLIKSKKINIYPYAGLSLRNTSLVYQQPDLVNNNFTSIVDIVQKDGTTEGNKLNLAYQAGLGFDFVIHEGDKGDGTMLFLRAGTDGIFGNRTFKIHGVKYDADIKQGAWIFAFGFKFFVRG